LVGGVTGGLKAEGLGWGFRVERESVKEKRLKKREKRSDSQHFKGLKRGVLRAFWDLKTENGVFFGQKSFLTQFSLFSLDFFACQARACTGAEGFTRTLAQHGFIRNETR
jgi:hypothetical protein